MNQKKIIETIRRLLYGRYGFDQLSQAFIVMSLILTLLTMFTKNYILILLSYLPFLYAVWRVMSKNISKRSQENYKFTIFIGKLKEAFKQAKQLLVGTKTHKYYKCSKCQQTIRVPRGKGKICITCPKCRMEFIKRT